jgi:Type IV pilus assembly protein PilM
MDAFIKRAFPVPRFLLPPRLSVEVCDGCLRFFEFAWRLDSGRPKSFGTLPFPRVNMGKADEDRSAAKTALGTFARERGYGKAHVIVHEAEAYVFCVIVRTLNPGELRTSIESVLEENVPIPPAEAVFEFDVLDVDRMRGETLVAVSVVAQTTLLNYVDLFKSAGILPSSFETEARALSRALFLPSDTSTRIVISVGRNHTTAFIAQGGAVVFSSSIEVGSADIDQSIAQAFGISPDEAALMKDQKGFEGQNEDPKLFLAMSPVLSIIRDELAKVLVYWRSQGRKERDLKEISEIILCGKDASLSGFSRYLSAHSKLPVRLGSVWTGVPLPAGIVPELSLEDSLDYGAVIGGLI